MTKFKEALSWAALILFFGYIGYVAVAIVVQPAMAQSAPSYGTYPTTVATSSSTADVDILAAPGANYRWVVTNVNYNILVEEADKLVVIEDEAGTPVNIAEFAPEVQGTPGTFFYGEGIECSVNSAVQVDVTSTTADIWVSVTAYKEYVP